MADLHDRYNSGRKAEVTAEGELSIKSDTLLESLSQLAMSITNPIDEEAYDLNAAAFSETTSIADDYKVVGCSLVFTTAESKTITITLPDGSEIGGSLDTSASNPYYNTTKQSFIVKEFIGCGFNADENITIEVTQTSGACSLNVTLSIEKGSNTLVGDPTAYLQNPNNIKIYPATNDNVETARGNLSGNDWFRGYASRKDITTDASGADIWSGDANVLPLPPDVGEQMSIVSTSTADTSAGTGIRTVKIVYLDANGDEQTEIATMNGITAVDTSATDIRFVQYMHTASVGSNKVAEGDITLFKKGVTSTVYMEINEGGNMSLNTARMVPNGKTFYLQSWRSCATGGKPIEFRIRSTSYDGVLFPGIFLFIDTSYEQDGHHSAKFDVPIKIPSLAIIKITAWSDFVGGYVSGSWNGWFE